MNQIKVRLKPQLPLSQVDDGIDYMIVEIMVDDIVLVDFSYYATDLSALLESINANRNYYILTCWCGDPGCAGLNRGINVQHKDGLVYWHITQPEPERKFIFELERYRREIEAVVEQGNRLIKTMASTNKDERRIEIAPARNETFFRWRSTDNSI